MTSAECSCNVLSPTIQLLLLIYPDRGTEINSYSAKVEPIDGIDRYLLQNTLSTKLSR